MNEKFVKYAATLGFNPESPVFNYVVKNLIDLDTYIKNREKDSKDSMYLSE